MPEDAGKKRYIRNFLEQINQGEGYVGDIWIERDLRLPGKEGEGYTTAKSLSGNSSISNITELLLDDLKRTFDDGKIQKCGNVPGVRMTKIPERFAMEKSCLFLYLSTPENLLGNSINSWKNSKVWKFSWCDNDKSTREICHGEIFSLSLPFHS